MSFCRGNDPLFKYKENKYYGIDSNFLKQFLKSSFFFFSPAYCYFIPRKFYKGKNYDLSNELSTVSGVRFE